MTGSVFKANLAYDAFKEVLRKTVDLVKDSVAEYSKHENAVRQTEAVLKSTGGAAGLTRDAVLGLSEALMQSTGVEHDSILEAENLLLTFTSIGKDIFPQATETVLDMSVALGQDLKSSSIQLGKALQDPILGVTALRRVGVNFNEESRDTIKSLVDTGHAAEAQAMILKELQTEFGGSARAARDTFSGALKALNNQFDDVKESIGFYVAKVSRPFIESTIDMAHGVVEFLNSAEGMAKIESVVVPAAGALSVLFEVGKSLVGMGVDLAKTVGSDLKKAFTDVAGKGNEANVVFDVLGGVVRGVGIAFTVAGKTVGVVIQYVVDLVGIVKESVNILKDFGAAIADPFNKDKWAKVGQDVAAAWDAIKTTATHVFTGVKDIVVDTVKEFETFGKDAAATGKSLQTAYRNSASAVARSLDDIATSTATSSTMVTDATDDMVASTANLSAAFSVVEEQLMADPAFYEAYKEAITDTGDAVEEETETIGDLHGNLTKAIDDYGLLSTEGLTALQKLVAGSQDAAEKVTGFISQMAGQVFDIVDAVLTNEQTIADNAYKADQRILKGQLDDLETSYEAKRAYIEANVTDEEAKAAQLKALDDQYKVDHDALLASVAESDDAHNAKIADIKRKQWRAQQVAALASIVISTAQGVMTAMATIPPPWGEIAAGLVLAAGVVQGAIVASQTMPDFEAAEGGVFPPGRSILVGERGPEVVRLGQTSRIVPNAEAFGGGGGINQHITFGDVHNDVDLNRASLLLARRTEAALRSA